MINVLRGGEFRQKLTRVGLAGTLALAACSSGDASPETTPGTVSSTTVLAPETTLSTATSASPEAETAVTITFDYLGGGSKVIQVYAGPEDTEADKVVTGTYFDGDVVEADCKIEGRDVNSVPNLGEEERSSDDWIKLRGFPQFATAVYIEEPQKVLDQLEPCS